MRHGFGLFTGHHKKLNEQLTSIMHYVCQLFKYFYIQLI
jgi:hypothetical protein